MSSKGPILTTNTESSDTDEKWSFDLALDLLKRPSEVKRLSSLNRFLSSNEELLVNPLAFEESKNASLPSADTFTLRGSSYTTTEHAKALAESISKDLELNKLEVLRVISHHVSKSSNTKFKKDYSEKELKTNKTFYTKLVLKERRKILELTRYLLTHDTIESLNGNYSQNILENSQYISNLIKLLETSLDVLSTSTSDQQKTSIYSDFPLFITEVLKILPTLLLKVSTTPSNVVKWFKLWQSNSFFINFRSAVPKEAFEEIKSLISLASLLFLGLNTNSDTFDESSPYVSDSEALKQIQNSIATSPNDPIVIYAWSIVLYSINENSIEDQDQWCKTFAIKAAELKVFQDIEEKHSILSYDNFHTAILSSFLISAIPFIQLTDTTSKTYLKVFQDAPNSFVEKFFLNPNTEALLQVSKAKFPELITPYLRILSTNGPFAHSELSSLSTYMNIVTTQNLGYETDTDSDSIVLKEGFYINPPYEQKKDVLLYLPPSTKGKIFPTADHNTEAVIFQHNYNGWSLLGRILQNIVLFPEQEDVLLVILGLLTSTLSSSSIDATSDLFEDLSAFVDDGDILDIILRLFEQSLHQRNSKVLTELVKLLTALLSTYPQIVWSHLGRSDLLEHIGRGGLIFTILGSVETINGEYDFTIASLKLYNELVNSSLTGHDDLFTHKHEVISKFTKFSIQVFESFMYWNYNLSYQKYELATLILDTFSKILYAIYGIDPEAEPSNKITKVLADSAQRLISSFTVSSPDVRITKPIFSSLEALTQQSSYFDSSGKIGFWFTQWTEAHLEFSRLVISIRSTVDRKPSTLESTFFVESKTLVRIYTENVSLRSAILQLFTQLVSAKWQLSEVPSLLAHLGDESTKTLVKSLTEDLKFTYDDFKVKRYIYTFFSSIILGNQKGLASKFLEGEDSVIKTLKVDIQNIDYYPESLSIHLVDSIAYALNSWSSEREENDQFVQTLVQKLKSIKPTQDDLIQSCYQYKLSSKIAEICALILFSSKKSSTTKTIIDALDSDKLLELIEPLYKSLGYLHDLHDSLNQKFNDKWEGLHLKQFIRSPLAVTTNYGEGAVYDLRLLDDILGENIFWTGSGLTEGYRSEVITASVNLQYVSAQISSAKSWAALLTAFGKKFGPQKSFWEIIKKLLSANITEGTDIELFQEIFRVRTELSFFLLHVLPGDRENDNKEVLELALQLINSSSVDVLNNLAINNSHIYKPLLRIISKSLSSIKSDTDLQHLSDALLQFFETVVAKGSTILLESIKPEINSDNISGRIEDILLVISVFKSLIAAKLPSYVLTKFSAILNDFGTLRSLLNLYSSSHQLNVNNEPVFAELTLTYIIELINVDGIAEELISSGLFSVLIESPISVKIQEGDIYVQTNPRLHNIWSNGLLAIILFLLSKFGTRLLPEVDVFVNYFSKQINSTINSWSQESIAISIPAIQETEQIIILQRALKTLYQEYGEISPRPAKQIEIFPGLDAENGKKSLSNSLFQLLAHPKFLTSRVIPTTLEEQRLFEGEDKIRSPLVEQIVVQIKDLKYAVTNYI